jgi:hypothetical protein
MWTVTADCYYGYSTYTLSGKQFINNNWYNRVLNRDSSAHSHCSPPIYLNSTVLFDTLFIRQDSALKKIWIYDSTSNTDKM